MDIQTIQFNDAARTRKLVTGCFATGPVSSEINNPLSDDAPFVKEFIAIQKNDCECNLIILKKVL